MQVNNNELFKNRPGRIMASFLCRLGIHQNQLAANESSTELLWYCAFCGKVSNTIKGVKLETHIDPEQTILTHRGN